jgi:hypothetical protein
MYFPYVRVLISKLCCTLHGVKKLFIYMYLHIYIYILVRWSERLNGKLVIPVLPPLSRCTTKSPTGVNEGEESSSRVESS